ncbi:2-oxoglutarate ferredoxin oxidoreductase subunit alpha [Deltaproteobacteria bacterium]|nr:2-oxoglutarate ferredoxin oxidoreductase subunit alpha [Deltaproteobacteria bacterium]
MTHEFKILTGNDACTLGALAAGMNFFAGYPITPATEIAELASELLPKFGGKFMQMEDELASISAVIGASFAGAKAMTATSGPGFTLMQENIGYGILAEVPCVVINVMRQGPCQGVATVPAQGDIMQSRWGTHGDHPAIVLAPCSVQEAYYETIRAFNLAEHYRTPVTILSDATLAHMSEKVRIPLPDELHITNRKRPTGPKDKTFKPYADDGTGIPPMAVFGDGYRWYVSGIIHDETGFPSTNDPDMISLQIKRLLKKVESNIDKIESYEEYLTEDADVLIVSIGLVARSAKAAIDIVRKEGRKVGLLRPVTVWPFPERRLQELAKKARLILTCEMNEGQLAGMAEQAVKIGAEVVSLTQNNGKMITAETICKALREV